MVMSEDSGSTKYILFLSEQKKTTRVSFLISVQLFNWGCFRGNNKLDVAKATCNPQRVLYPQCDSACYVAQAGRRLMAVLASPEVKGNKKRQNAVKAIKKAIKPVKSNK